MTNLATRREILVGVDPREPSVPVLAWAVEEAERRCVSLRLLVSIPPLHDTQHVDTTPHHMALQAQGERALAAAVETVLSLDPEARVEAELLDGMPAAVLCRRAASQARMVVVGSRRLSRPEEIFSREFGGRPPQRPSRLPGRRGEGPYRPPRCPLPAWQRRPHGRGGHAPPRSLGSQRGAGGPGDASARAYHCPAPGSPDHGAARCHRPNRGDR